jgi:hypothetical protein
MDNVCYTRKVRKKTMSGEKVYIFKFNLTEFPEKRTYAILDEMDEKRGGAIGMFSDSIGEECYLGLLDDVDATEFRQRLQALEVEFTEPKEFPAEIRNSSDYKTAMKLLGLG